jgi:hypothetical protein
LNLINFLLYLLEKFHLIFIYLKLKYINLKIKCIALQVHYKVTYFRFNLYNIKYHRQNNEEYNQKITTEENLIKNQIIFFRITSDVL